MTGSTSAPAFSRELARQGLSRGVTWYELEPLRSDEQRDRLIEEYLAIVEREESRPELTHRGAGGIVAVFASVGLSLYHGPAEYALLGVVPLGLLGGVYVVQRWRRHGRIGGSRVQREIRKHFDRAVFNAGQRWSSWTHEERRRYLAEDLGLLLEVLALPSDEPRDGAAA